MNSLEINNKCQFNETNYYLEETPKSRIILGGSNRLTLTSKGNIDFTFFNALKNRDGGNCKKTPMYSIDVNGVVYNHFPDKYYSDFVEDEFRPEEAISIMLHNEGPLAFNNSKLAYATWDGKKTGIDNPTNLEWRGEFYWAPYTEAQYVSLKHLIGFLSEKHNIQEKFIDSNTLDLTSFLFSGVISRANLSTFYLDLNPTFDWEKLK